MFVFWEIWRALFSWNTRFEIRPFALLSTNCLPKETLIGPPCIAGKRFTVQTLTWSRDTKQNSSTKTSSSNLAESWSIWTHFSYFYLLLFLWVRYSAYLELFWPVFSRIWTKITLNTDTFRAMVIAQYVIGWLFKLSPCHWNLWTTEILSTTPSKFQTNFNPYLPSVTFWSPWKHQKTKDFLMFSRGLKWNIGK